jgi:hypothetical protein
MRIFAELYLGTVPWSKNGGVPRCMVKVLGPLPQIWCGHYRERPQTDASWYDQIKQPESTLEAMITHARPDVSSTKCAHVLSFMQNVSSCEPQDRMTATQLLCDSSFKLSWEFMGPSISLFEFSVFSFVLHCVP